MTIPGIERLQQASDWLRRQFVSEPLILLYHRVVDLTSDPQLLSVTPKHFNEHLEILRNQAHPIKLQELNEYRRNRDLPKRTVIVTFDDGYADNLREAKPLLERFDIPVTVFVTTGYTGRQLEFWWDDLERLLLQPGSLPGTIRFNINGKTHEWHLMDDAHYSENSYQRHLSWNVLKKDKPTKRHDLYLALCRLLRSFTEEERRPVLDYLIASSGAGTQGRSTHQPLSRDEVLRLAKGGLVEIGAHSVTHSVLSVLSPEMQRKEILESKSSLEELLGHPLSSFAYPFGTRSDYTKETVRIVQESGFNCACSNFSNRFWPNNDNYQLPRLLVRNWDGETFQRQLSDFLHA